MFMACLYDEWYDEEKQTTLRSFSILTTEPCTKLAWLHDRMPVILVGTDQARAPTHPAHAQQNQLWPFHLEHNFPSTSDPVLAVSGEAVAGGERRRPVVDVSAAAALPRLRSPRPRRPLTLGPRPPV